MQNDQKNSPMLYNTMYRYTVYDNVAQYEDRGVFRGDVGDRSPS